MVGNLYIHHREPLRPERSALRMRSRTFGHRCRKPGQRCEDTGIARRLRKGRFRTPGQVRNHDRFDTVHRSELALSIDTVAYSLAVARTVADATTLNLFVALADFTPVFINLQSIGAAKFAADRLAAHAFPTTLNSGTRTTGKACVGIGAPIDAANGIEDLWAQTRFFADATAINARFARATVSIGSTSILTTNFALTINAASDSRLRLVVRSHYFPGRQPHHRAGNGRWDNRRHPAPVGACIFTSNGLATCAFALRSDAHTRTSSLAGIGIVSPIFATDWRKNPWAITSLSGSTQTFITSKATVAVTIPPTSIATLNFTTPALHCASQPGAPG